MLRWNVVAAAAVLALAVPVTAGCSAVDRALDCATTASAIARSVDDLQQAISDAGEDPTQARESLDSIEKNLTKIEDETDDGDVGKAVSQLRGAVDSVRADVEAGRAPEAKPVTDAADELTKVCSPG
ncbi:hypothetical protein [Streptomyces reniochalinae]|uniref:Secreted protein n=1 Tax=Streptomyces reniochalinae TaxID=2250578 RepID=A0A367F4D3_9ACTN|nr:hypothetical protein [Streptomyces reniochalinae]RCG24537.1 hypothetical protein DQ392_02085 [Streptomyces reniochalinae]